MVPRDMASPAFVKSSHSADSGCCVEVARQAGTVSVRDSTDREGPVLDFSRHNWGRFVAGIKHGSWELN
ncbi:MAG TPA: DUF397 domain-containing protein [Micromonosporaceae bacterium]|nr:DUF397 domain-containing protein [Micromonosporaceae bacterium]